MMVYKKDMHLKKPRRCLGLFVSIARSRRERSAVDILGGTNASSREFDTLFSIYLISPLGRIQAVG